MSPERNWYVELSTLRAARSASAFFHCESYAEALARVSVVDRRPPRRGRDVERRTNHCLFSPRRETIRRVRATHVSGSEPCPCAPESPLRKVRKAELGLRPRSDRQTFRIGG